MGYQKKSKKGVLKCIKKKTKAFEFFFLFIFYKKVTKDITMLYKLFFV